MSAFVVASYRITNPDGFSSYPEASIPTILSHGGEILAADFASEVVEGTAPHTTIVLRFSDKGAMRRWYHSDEYQAIVHLRRENTDGALILVNEFVLPDGPGPKPWERRDDRQSATS